MIRLAQQGKIETILSHKEDVALNHLFEIPKNCDTFSPALPPPLQRQPLKQTSKDPLNGLKRSFLSSLQPNPRTILIEGAPGGGKSTLALHICHQWAQGASWLDRFDVVVIAYLRDEAIQNAKTLADILPADGDSSELVPLIQASYGYRVLFIFDGWDEFPYHLMNKSLVSTIIRQPHELSLHLSTVLITSRPVSSGNLLHIADRRVEVLGFTKHQIHDYIEKALDGKITHIQKLIQHLEEHPVIEGYCYVPLHVAIMVHIFLTGKGTLPTTFHELFCSLVLCCIVREQATHEPDTCLPELSSLDDLPDDLKSKLNNLSILAYNGVMQNKVVFYFKDLQESHLPSKLPSLGLLQAVEGLTLYSKSLSYNFLHLSVQELLAAYNISQMDPIKQVEVFKELFASSRFQAVLHYYCGFTKLANPEVQTFMSSFQSETMSFKDLLPLLHCFFEAQQPSLCQLVDSRLIHVPNEKQILNSRDLTPVDFLVVGYFITSLLSTSTANTPTIHLVVDGIDDHRLKMLLNDLSKYSIGGIPTSAGTLSLKLKLNEHPVGRIPTSAGAALSLKLELCLTSLKFSRKFVSAITKMLQVKKLFTHIDLSYNRAFGDSEAHWIFEGLQNNTTLINLNLSHTGIANTDLGTARSLTKMLQVNKSLTHLDLSNNITFSDPGARWIFEGLQNNTTLVNLNLSRTGITATDPDTARSLTKMFQINKSLTHLDLSKNRLSDSGAHSIFEGLTCNITLVNLNLSHTGIVVITPETALSLTKMLQVNKSLTHLDLSNYPISFPHVMKSIFEGLKHNSTLRYLNLHAVTEITDTIAEYIAEALQINRALQTLDISDCMIGRNEIDLILESLMSNSTLQTLYISYIGSSVCSSTFKRARETKNLPPIDIV